MRREVLDETGLDVKEAEGGYVFTYHRENPGEGDNYFVDVYRYTMDVTEQDVHLQTEETDGCRFATPEEIGISQIREFSWIMIVSNGYLRTNYYG